MATSPASGSPPEPSRPESSKPKASRPEPHAALIAAIHAALATHSDPVRAAGQQRYMKSAIPYLGLTSPLLKRTLRPILGDPAYRLDSRERWEATVRGLWDGATHREHWYAALALAGHRHYRAWRDLDVLGLYRHLILTGQWWDVVDEIATHRLREVLDDHPVAMSTTLRQWAIDDNLWVRRSAMLSQVGRRDRTDPRLLADTITPNIEGRDFFSRKAIGWALRDYARTEPDWVRAFVAAHPDLSGLSRREALKHLT
jgi:3-methyladenine DNA glycosylase AlkD